ncbi:molybdopterin-binding protein [Halobium palmae]|uniref:Molybdopterin-binding protein n=1 Tax=Halobium palmae TaxID=1776492 RepID=A0ABD5S1Y3_9EURY
MNDGSDHGRGEGNRDDGQDHDHEHGDELDHDHNDDDGHGQDHHDDGHGQDHHDDGHDQDHDHDDGHDHDDHDHHHHDVESVGVAVVTVSSSRSLDDDPAGDAVVEAFEAEGHEVVVRNLVADDYDGVQGEVESLVGRKDVGAVVTTGGTGVTPDDVKRVAEPVLAHRLVLTPDAKVRDVNKADVVADVLSDVTVPTLE